MAFVLCWVSSGWAAGLEPGLRGCGPTLSCGAYCGFFLPNKPSLLPLLTEMKACGCYRSFANEACVFCEPVPAAFQLWYGVAVNSELEKHTVFPFWPNLMEEKLLFRLKFRAFLNQKCWLISQVCWYLYVLYDHISDVSLLRYQCRGLIFKLVILCIKMRLHAAFCDLTCSMETWKVMRQTFIHSLE